MPYLEVRELLRIEERELEGGGSTSAHVSRSALAVRCEGGTLSSARTMQLVEDVAGALGGLGVNVPRERV